jgi:hypothetical protein
MADSKKILPIIQKRHPEYETMKPEWDFWLGSYRGGKSYIKENLDQYYKEGDEEFKDRRNRSHRENHCRRVVDLVNSYLFKELPTRDVQSDIFEKFKKNADGRGKTLTQFMKRASAFASVLGRVYIVMDKMPLPEEVVTGTHADNLENIPYCYLVYPQAMKDISFDENGKIRWALVEETRRDDEDPFESTGDIVTEYRLWFPGGWILYSSEGNLLTQGENGLPSVPIVTLNNEEDSEYQGMSLIADISTLDRAIFNNWSRLDAIICDQTFSQLIFPIEGLTSEVITDPNLREQFLTLAMNRVLLYSSQAAMPPSFISPDASQANLILSTIEQQVNQLYASLGLSSEVGTEVNEASGVSKAYDFDKLNKLLAGKADNLEQCENEIIELLAGWTNTTIDGEVDYPDEFDVKSLADEIRMAQELALLNISATFQKEIEKLVVAKALPKAKKEVIEKIHQELEERVDEEKKLREEEQSLMRDLGGIKSDVAKDSKKDLYEEREKVKTGRTDKGDAAK